MHLLELIKQRCNKHALLSTPKDFIEQHVEANPFEDHRSHWTLKELNKAGFVEILPNALSWIAVYTKQ
jgi:ribosome-associated toxin RatA of RatAB toxin-antitoxin module